MKIVSPFEPLSFWAQGPWVFFNLGLKFMQSWQEECFSRLRLTAATGKPATRPELKLKSPSELDALGAAIAARQGRETPLLGCLQGAQVVGGPQSVVVSPKVVLVEPVAKAAAVKPAAPAKPKAEAVAAKAEPVVAKPAVAKAAPAAPKVEPVAAKVEAPQPGSLFSDEAAPVVAATLTDAATAAAPVPSVTSMLAMQAKSLAKAVKTAPPAIQHGKTNGKSAAKSTAKSTAKVTAQAAAKAAAPKAKPVAKPTAKAKPAASKKA